MKKRIGTSSRQRRRALTWTMLLIAGCEALRSLACYAGTGDGGRAASTVRQKGGERPIAHARNALRDYKFTNELGQAICLNDFRGQAIALAFFFTRCPNPQYCPRLSRNFAEAQSKMSAMANAPTNWHLLSITFDPERDTPKALKAYGDSYHYNPAHWSFLTGPQDKIAELARDCDVKFAEENGFFNHNFRTLIIDASNRLQMVFPTSGDLSDAIVRELLKGAAADQKDLGK